MKRVTVMACSLVALLTACSSASGTLSTSSEPVTTHRASTASGFALQQLGSFTQPVWAGVAPGDKRIFVVEKGGRIRIIGQSAPFLDISTKVSTGSEQGLLSMAFANDWTTSHRFYVDYTDTHGDSQVYEYSGSATQADPQTARKVLSQSQPYPKHNGGLLLMQPDNTMLVGFGDGGSSGDPQQRAQNMGTWLGKILRIDPRKNGTHAYTVPANNPYIHESGAKPEIYILGVRNPWRFSVDPLTKDLWIGDVGQDKIEEIDDLPASTASGANLGWSHYEGNSVYSSHPMTHADRYVKPVRTYTHSDGSCSITGGVVYRGSISRLRGHYLFIDFCKTTVRSYNLKTHQVGSIVDGAQQVSSFGVDSSGEVLVVSLGGAVSRIVAG